MKPPGWYANRCCANWFPGPTPAMRADLEAMAREVLLDAAALVRAQRGSADCTCRGCMSLDEAAGLLRRAAGGAGE